jgi:hypothetical protein
MNKLKVTYRERKRGAPYEKRRIYWLVDPKGGRTGPFPSEKQAWFARFIRPISPVERSEEEAKGWRLHFDYSSPEPSGTPPDKEGKRSYTVRLTDTLHRALLKIGMGSKSVGIDQMYRLLEMHGLFPHEMPEYYGGEQVEDD